MTAALVLVGAVKPLLAWAVFGELPVLDPDTSLYAQGGLGVWPSPLGRLVGVGGLPALVALNVAANALLVLGVVLLAASSSSSGAGAAERRTFAGARRAQAAGLLVLVSPLAVWSIFVGMDTIAAAALVFGLLALRRAHRTASKALGGLAAGFHMAAIAVLAFAWTDGRSGMRYRAIGSAAVALLGLALALVTPYGAALQELDLDRAASSAIATAAVFGLTFLPWLPRLRPALPAIAGGAVCSGLMASSSWETNCRYMLPAVAIASAAAVRSSNSFFELRRRAVA